MIGAAGLLFASWVLPATRTLWESADEAVFATLNGTLDASGPDAWNALWALLNARYFDVPTFVVMGLLLIACCLARGKRKLLAGLAVFPVLVMLLILAREALEATADVMGWNHVSPSMRHESSVYLSQLYPDWDTKDKSRASFPGDHAGVLFLWMGYCLYLVRNRWSLLATSLTLLALLPRLFSGAHALSDELVGGGVAALLALATGLFTPACAPAIRKLARAMDWTLRRVGGCALPRAWIEGLTLETESCADTMASANQS